MDTSKIILRTQWSFHRFSNRNFIQINVTWIGYAGIADVFCHQDSLIIRDRNAHRALTVIAIIVSHKMYYFNKYM